MSPLCPFRIHLVAMFITNDVPRALRVAKVSVFMIQNPLITLLVLEAVIVQLDIELNG